jgi:hypothetical protein
LLFSRRRWLRPRRSQSDCVSSHLHVDGGVLAETAARSYKLSRAVSVTPTAHVPPSGRLGVSAAPFSRFALTVPEQTAKESGVPSTTPQAVDARLTRAAIFLVATINAGAASEAAVRSLCGDLASLIRGVGFRELDGGLSCVMGIGSTPGSNFGERRNRKTCTRSAKSAACITPSPPRATFSFISARRAWICVSSSRRESSRGSAPPSR